MHSIGFVSDGQGFEKPPGVRGKGHKGKGQGQDIHTLEKPLPLSRVRGLQGLFKCSLLPQEKFHVASKLLLSIEILNFKLKTPGLCG